MSKKSQTSTKTLSSRLTRETTVVLKNSAQNERYVSGIFDNEEKIID